MKLFVLKLNENEEAFLAFLPKERQREIARFRRAEDRLRSAAAEWLARRELSLRLNLPPEQIELTRERGKPAFPGQPFNLSHSGRCAVCLFGEFPVGVDVERVVPRSRALLRCLSEAERRAVSESDDPLSAFYRFWTAKESVCKLRGEGISRIRRIEIFPDDEKYSHAEEDGAPLPDRIVSLKWDMGCEKYVISYSFSPRERAEAEVCFLRSPE